MLKRLLIVMLCYWPAGVSLAETVVHVLDVKEGQSVLLSADGRGLLIDTGHAGEAQGVLQKLAAYGVEQLEFIILTHLHPDHASGYFRIREAFPHTPVLTGCHPLPKNVSPDMTRWLHEALAGDAHHRCVGAGDTITFADGQIDIIWPHRFVNANLNRHSLVLHIKNESGSILLMGDAGQSVERQLLKNQRLPGHVDTLIVGHHGAADATGDDLLDHVRPKRAVISVNANNVRGYRAAQVLKRLKARNIPVYRTDIHHDIAL